MVVQSEHSNLLPRTTPRPSTQASTTTKHGNVTTFSPAVAGYFFIALASVLFASTDFLGRLATAHFSVPPDSMMFIRSIVHLVITSLYTYLYIPRSQLFSFSSRERLSVVVYGLMQASAMFTLFRALSLLPVGEVTAILFTNPAFTLIFAAVLLQDPFTSVHLLVIIACSVGVYLVCGLSPTSLVLSPSSVKGISYAVAASIFDAVSFIVARGLGTKVPAPLAVMSSAVWLLLITSLSGGFTTLGTFIGYGPKAVASVLSSNIISAFLSSLFVMGFQRCPPGPGSIISTIAVPVAYVEGLIFLGETPNINAVVGSGLVVMGTVIMGIDLVR